MMLLNGYTLGFFFPKQTMHLAAAQPKPEIPDDHRTVDLSRTRPDAESESREVPASYYFYRYF